MKYEKLIKLNQKKKVLKTIEKIDNLIDELSYLDLHISDEEADSWEAFNGSLYNISTIKEKEIMEIERELIKC